MSWAGDQKRVLLESGAEGVQAKLCDGPPTALERATYLGPPRKHTDDLARLKRGRSIGRGMVEGACKTAIGTRRRQTGARWKDRRVAHMAALGCLRDSDRWDAFWKHAAR